MSDNWTRQQLLVAFNLYCKIPFGKLHQRNPEIIRFAKFINRTPSALAMKLSNIASLDPAITSTGRKGLSGASEADKSMWKEMQKNWEKFAIESEKVIYKILISNEQKSRQMLDQKLEEQADYSSDDKVIQTKARMGQNFFRNAVLSAYNNKCCICGLSIPKLLVASHIIPWSEDKANRLNPKNGLSLSVLHDKAFDLGLITINEDMTVRVTQKKYITNDKFFDKALKYYDKKPIILPEKFQPDKDFLAYHRNNIFENEG